MRKNKKKYKEPICSKRHPRGVREPGHALHLGIINGTLSDEHIDDLVKALLKCNLERGFTEGVLHVRVSTLEEEKLDVLNVTSKRGEEEG